MATSCSVDTEAR